MRIVTVFVGTLPPYNFGISGGAPPPYLCSRDSAHYEPTTSVLWVCPTSIPRFSDHITLRPTMTFRFSDSLSVLVASPSCCCVSPFLSFSCHVYFVSFFFCLYLVVPTLAGFWTRCIGGTVHILTSKRLLFEEKCKCNLYICWRNPLHFFGEVRYFFTTHFHRFFFTTQKAFFFPFQEVRMRMEEGM